MILFPQIRGEILDYDIIVIGHMKWTIYFNETKDNLLRGEPSTCTSTLIRGKDNTGKNFNLIIDPTLRVKSEDFYFDINRRTGLCPSDITHCFATHEHMDHFFGFNYFPDIEWLAPKPVVEQLRRSEHIDASKIKEVHGEFLPGVYALPIPGHKNSLHGVAFIFNKRKIIIAGDSVMTKYHYKAITTNETIDEDNVELAKQNIRRLKEIADIIIPGHDNIIINN